MKKRILGIGLGLCLAASGLVAFTGCGGESKEFDFKVDFDPATICVGVDANKDYSSSVINKDGDYKYLNIDGYKEIYNYDNMTITINGEPAGDRFEKGMGGSLGRLRISGMADKSIIKIRNVEDKYIKVGFILDASSLIKEENRRKFDTLDEQLDYTTNKAMAFASSLRIKMSDSDLAYWKSRKDSVEANTSEHGTVFTEFFQDAEDVIYTNASGEAVKAPYKFTFKMADLYKAKVETESFTENSIVRQYNKYNYSYAGIPVYSESAAGYFTSPRLTSYTVAASFTDGEEFTGYLGDELISSMNKIVKDFTDESLSKEELLHKERMEVNLQDNAVVVIDPTSFGASSIQLVAEDGLSNFKTDETGSSCSYIEYPVNTVRKFETIGLSNLRNTYNVDFTNATYKLNDYTLTRAKSEEDATKAIENGTPAICYYDEESGEFKGWINKDILPSHFCSKEALLENLGNDEQYRLNLIGLSYPKENFTAILAKNSANDAINPGSLGAVYQIGIVMNPYTYKGKDGIRYIHKTDEDLTLQFTQPCDFSANNKKTQVIIKKNGILEKTIDLASEYIKFKDTLTESKNYFEFTDGAYSFKVQLGNLGSGYSIDRIENLYVTTSLEGVELYEVETVLVNK